MSGLPLQGTSGRPRNRFCIAGLGSERTDAKETHVALVQRDASKPMYGCIEVDGMHVDGAELVESIRKMPADRKTAAVFVLNILRTTAQSKGKDYGADTDPFFNYQQIADMKGLPGWHEPANRLVEKAIRLILLLARDIKARCFGMESEFANEDMKESMTDIVWLPAIVYAMHRRDTRGTVSEAVASGTGIAHGES